MQESTDFLSLFISDYSLVKFPMAIRGLSSILKRPPPYNSNSELYIVSSRLRRDDRGVLQFAADRQRRVGRAERMDLLSDCELLVVQDTDLAAIMAVVVASVTNRIGK